MALGTSKLFEPPPPLLQLILKYMDFAFTGYFHTPKLDKGPTFWSHFHLNIMEIILKQNMSVTNRSRKSLQRKYPFL